MYLKTLDLTKGLVDISDPGYDRQGHYQLLDVKVIPGHYSCDYKKNEITGWGNRVTECSITLMGSYQRYPHWKRLGTVGVDAGHCGFFTSPKKEYEQKEWEALVEEIYQSESKGEVYSTTEAFFTSSGIGDGIYKVYVSLNFEGDIRAIKIDFAEEEDDEGEDEE